MVGFVLVIYVVLGEFNCLFDGFVGWWNCSGYFVSGKVIVVCMEYVVDFSGNVLFKYYVDWLLVSYCVVEFWSQLLYVGWYVMVVLDNFGGI